MLSDKTIAVDVMSGDFGPDVLVPACIDFLSENSQTRLLLVGDSYQIKPQIPHHLIHRADVIHCDQVIAMDEKPAAALRLKNNSSLHVAVGLVNSSHAGACVSAGNTGALIAIAKILLGMITGVNRPAIFGMVPSVDCHSYLLDMGANVDCNAEQLLEFALMGTLVVKALDGKLSPSVALLNNGQEEIKGNSQVKQAAELLTACENINYIGFIEGHNLYQAVADIIVCDGFVGNIALKASEGVANFILDVFRREISTNYFLRPFLWLLSLMTRAAVKRIDPRYLNGATVLGVKGIVVKSHGHADSLAFQQCLHHADRMIDADIVRKLEVLSSLTENQTYKQ